MPFQPTETEVKHAEALVDGLDRQLDQKDNAGTAESIQQITRMVTTLIDRAAEGAKQTLRRVLIILVIGVAATAFTAYYIIEVAGLHPAWAALPINAMLVPGVVLLIGVRMLMAVVSLPGNLGELGEILASIARDHLHELHLLTDKNTLGGLLKWRAYILVARLLWKCRKMTKEKQNEISGGIILFGLVANPLFWMVLLGAIIVLLAECAVMLGAIALHAMLF